MIHPLEGCLSITVYTSAVVQYSLVQMNGLESRDSKVVLMAWRVSSSNLRRSGLTEGNFEVQILAVSFSCILRSSCANLSLTEALCPLVVKASMKYLTAWTMFNPLTSRSNLILTVDHSILMLVERI